MADIAIRHHHPHANQVKVASGLDVLAAVWLFISAFAVLMSPALAWSNVLIAVLIAILAAARSFGAYGQAWMSWANVVLGVWVLVSPWVVSIDPTGPAITNNVVTGLVIIVLAAWSALATNTERRPHTDRVERTA